MTKQIVTQVWIQSQECHMALCQSQLKALRWNPPEVRVTSGRKPSAKIIYIICKLLYDCFKYLLKKIISSNTKCQKRMLNFICNTWKYCWNETYDEILPVSAKVLWTLKFIFPCSHGKLFLVLFQAIIYVFSFKKM